MINLGNTTTSASNSILSPAVKEVVLGGVTMQ
jgi:hypothetical protein